MSAIFLKLTPVAVELISTRTFLVQVLSLLKAGGSVLGYDTSGAEELDTVSLINFLSLLLGLTHELCLKYGREVRW